MSYYATLVVVHIAAASLWFAGPLTIAPLLRRSAKQGPDALNAAYKQAKRSALFSALGNAAVLLSGLLLTQHLGGFSVMPPRFHIALSLVAIGAALAWGVALRICKALLRDCPKDLPAESLRALFVSGGLTHGLWFSCLVLMYWR